MTATLVTVDDVKNQCRISGDMTEAETDHIKSLILTATAASEIYQGRTYLQTQRTYKLDEFPTVIRPPYPPLLSVDSIEYVDTDGDMQTLDSDSYDVDTYTEPGRITEAYGTSWPSTRSVPNAVIVTYQAGYATASVVPAEIKHAVLLLIAHFYEHRESASEIRLTEIPQAYQALLNPMRIYSC